MDMLTIVPLQGLGALRFGMSKADVRGILGDPESANERNGTERLYWANALNTFFLNDSLYHIGATRRAEGILYQDVDIFVADPGDVLRRLQSDAGEAFEDLGFIVFPPLGITLSGFHDGDLDQKAMTLFPLGEWDDLRDEMKPVDFLA